MNWIVLAIFAYFLLAFESVANKFLIIGKVGSWRLYLFYIGLLSIVSLLLAPFGLHWYGAKTFFISVLSGMLFFGYLVFLFWALKGSTASRVFVLVGAVSTLATLVMSRLFLNDGFSSAKVVGILLLVAGGFLISFKFNSKKLFSNYQKVLLAGIFMAVSLVILKYAFGYENFISGYIYSRFGVTGMTLIMLILPSYRRKVFSQLKKHDSKKHASNLGAVIGIKTLGGAGSIIINYAVAAGSVAVVSALVSVQYLFVFILSIVLGFFFRDALREDLSRKNVLMKALGVVVVVLGIIFVTI